MRSGSSSSSYLSGFKSYSEENWPFRAVNENYSEYKTPEKNLYDFPELKSRTKDVPSFGDYKERHGWVECMSKSIPGKMYYYNLRSGCSTWSRPISRFVHIPRYVRKESNFSNVQCYLRSPSLLVSDDDDDCSYGSSIKLQEKNRRREWILEQLYYNPKNRKNEYRPRSWKKLSKNNGLNSLSDGSSSVSMCYNDEYGTENENEDNRSDSIVDDLSNADETVVINMTNFLECTLSEYSEFERCVDPGSMKTKLRNNLYNSEGDDSGLSSSNDNRGNNNEMISLVPRLKKIKYRDMLLKTVEEKKIKRKKVTKKSQVSLEHIKKEVPRKPEKIICNMYGVTTVNYNHLDYCEQELKLNVKRSNLSDSTTVVSSANEENRSRSSILKRFGRDDLDEIIPPLILSDSNSSSSSSSSSNSSSASSSSSSLSHTCDTCSSTSNTISDSTIL